MAHPQPKTTDEWLIDIYNKVEGIEHQMASLPCTPHTERITKIEHRHERENGTARFLSIVAVAIGVSGTMVAIVRAAFP